MRKFMLIVVSVVLTLFLASEARAQQVNYDYTYYTNGNSYVCAIRAPFGEVHVLHSHPVSIHTCRDHYRFFVRSNYPVKLFHISNGIYYTHWDKLRYNTDYLFRHARTTIITIALTEHPALRLNGMVESFLKQQNLRL